MEANHDEHHKLTAAQKLTLRELALNTAARINDKVSEIDVECMKVGYEQEGSVKQLLSDADKIYNWLIKSC